MLLWGWKMFFFFFFFILFLRSYFLAVCVFFFPQNKCTTMSFSYILTLCGEVSDTQIFSNSILINALSYNHGCVLNVKIIHWASYLLNAKLTIKTKRKYNVHIFLPYLSTFLYNSLLSPLTKVSSLFIWMFYLKYTFISDLMFQGKKSR